MKKLIVLSLILFSLLFTKAALASSTASFGIYPPKISVISPPNQKVKIPLKVISGNSLETLTFSASNIRADEEGSVELIDLQEEAITWLKINNNDLSKAQETINSSSESTINLTIDIPKNALVNDHYLALIVSAQNNESFSSSLSRAVAQIAIPIIISVKETSISEELKIESFDIPSISLSQVVPVNLKLKNPGKYLVETIGTITSKGPISPKHQALLPKDTVLAGQSRLVGGKNYTFNTQSLFGPTNITISIQLDQSKPLTISKSVFIIPITILLPILAVLIVIIFKIIGHKLGSKNNSRSKKTS